MSDLNLPLGTRVRVGGVLGGNATGEIIHVDKHVYHVRLDPGATDKFRRPIYGGLGHEASWLTYPHEAEVIHSDLNQAPVATAWRIYSKTILPEFMDGEDMGTVIAAHTRELLCYLACEDLEFTDGRLTTETVHEDGARYLVTHWTPNE